MFDRLAFPIVVTGAHGQLGAALAERLGDRAITLCRKQVDLSDPTAIIRILDEKKPAYIINAAAYTAVDKAEEEREQAFAVNGEAVRVMADYAFRNNIPFVHYSTDYVFPGTGDAPWSEEDQTSPLNAYGESKLAGEVYIHDVALQHSSARWLVFRTSWVYDELGKNFLNTMLRLGKEKEVMSVVGDQYGAPTYAGDLAACSLQALESALDMEEFPSGIYHLCNAGETSWHDFAEAIFRHASSLGTEMAVKEVRDIKTEEYPTPAARPHNSRLSMDKLKKIFDISPPDWNDALQRCLQRKLGIEKEQLKKVHQG